MNFLSLFKRNLFYKFKKKINIDNNNLKNKSLDELFFYFGSDKANYISKDKSESHGFSKFYIKHLNQIREKNINILEIGSFEGASAAAFSKYFYNSKIICLDINISKFIYSSKKIKVFGLDIKNRSEVKKILSKINNNLDINFFDVIIDDGSHNLSDMLLSFKIFFKYLNKGGTFVIEDFKFPNYYKRNKNIDHALFDEVIKNLNKKIVFKSSILTKEDQLFFHDNIQKISVYKGNLNNSDICFIKKF